MTDRAERDAAISRLTHAGADLTGATYGAFVGTALGGPVGAAVGAAVGGLLGATAKEFVHRVMSYRETVRVGAALHYATIVCEKRLAANQPIRDDSEFFPSPPRGRVRIDEVVEGVLLAAQRQYEERKVEFLGYLLGNLAFEQDVPASLANWATRTAGELSWTQLVLLSTIGMGENRNLPGVATIGKHNPTWPSFGIHKELAELGYGNRELIGAPAGKTGTYELTYPGMGLADQVLAAGGSLLYGLMWLDRIPADDRAATLQMLADAVPTETGEAHRPKPSG